MCPSLMFRFKIMIQATSKATTTRHDKSSLNHESKLTMLKARSRWSHDLCKHVVYMLIYLAAVYAKSVHPSDSPHLFRIRPSETPTYRPSPAGSKATPGEAPVKFTTFADHITGTEDFRQCEDFVTELATRDENCDDLYDHCCEHNGKHRHCGGWWDLDTALRIGLEDIHLKHLNGVLFYGTPILF